MKKTALILLAGGTMALSQHALAQTTPTPTPPPPGTTQTQIDAAANSNTTVIAIAGQENHQYPQRSEVEYSGHTWTTPSVAGSYFGGTNPCLVGTGGGAAAGPIGFSLNLGRSDPHCTRRSDAAAWHAMGFSNAAVARMCQDRDNADAFFESTGFACPGTGGTRYRRPDGSVAPEMTLVSQARSIPNNPHAAPLNGGSGGSASAAANPAAYLQSPEGQRMIQQAALAMIQNNPDQVRQMLLQSDQRRNFQQQRPPSFEENDDEPARPVGVPIPGTSEMAPPAQPATTQPTVAAAAPTQPR